MTDEYHNPFISDAVQAVHKATESANKNLDDALTVAVDALKRIGANYPRMTDLYRMKIANDALEQITSLEQKDVK